jgi:two-component sensor histidine kinase
MVLLWELPMSLVTVACAGIEPRFELSREADHRIGNSLATISGLVRVRARSAKDLDDPEAFLLEIADRIETVAKLHRLFAASDNRSVRLNDYLLEICQRLKSALSPTSVSFSVTCPPEHFVPFTTALPLGLITAELFSNSLKYAHPAGLPVKISVSCSRTGDGLTMTYEDDGVGFPEGFDVCHDGHLGMRFIRSLCAQLRGANTWLSDPLGIQFEIVVPVKNWVSEVPPGSPKPALSRGPHAAGGQK